MTSDTNPDTQGFQYGSNTQVTNTPFARLQRYLSDPSLVGKQQTPEGTPRFKGVENPYGRSLTAFEPNTTPYVAETQTAGSDVTKSTIDMPQGVNSLSGLPQAGGSRAGATVPQGNYATGGIADANGMVQKMINSALQLAANNVPYVWGGTSASGVDCSGLLQYAAKSAGLTSWARYRAQDYGHMGTAVTMAQARPGDVVYYDEGGGNGHVGLYLGNGMMVAAPQTGENVKVQQVYGTPTSIRRIWNDSSFASVATPNGGTTYSYNGRPMATPGASGPQFNPITPPPAPLPHPSAPAAPYGSGRVRPI